MEASFSGCRILQNTHSSQCHNIYLENIFKSKCLSTSKSRHVEDLRGSIFWQARSMPSCRTRARNCFYLRGKIDLRALWYNFLRLSPLRLTSTRSRDWNHVRVHFSYIFPFPFMFCARQNKQNCGFGDFARLTAQKRVVASIKLFHSKPLSAKTEFVKLTTTFISRFSLVAIVAFLWWLMHVRWSSRISCEQKLAVQVNEIRFGSFNILFVNKALTEATGNVFHSNHCFHYIPGISHLLRCVSKQICGL